jgi:RND family efflux transporter MFP subunit
MKTLLLTVLLWASFALTAEELISFSEAQQAALGINTAPATAISDNLSRGLPGEVVVPNAQLQIVTAPQPGLVEVLLVAEGDQVSKDQPLVRIQSPGLLELQGEYLEMLTRTSLANANYQRDRQLDKEGIIAKRKLLESESRYQELKTSLSMLRQSLELSGMSEASLATLESERTLSSTLTVLAPFDGVILEQMITAGNRVEAADPLYKIANLDTLWLEIHVPLEQLGGSSSGQKVTIPDVGVSGSIISIGRMVHRIDQGVLVRAEVTEGVGKLRPGQFVQVQLVTSAGGKGFRVPRAAVVHSAGQSYVFVARPGGFTALPVHIAGEEASHLVIQAQLTPDARIATTGVVAIKAAWLAGSE